MTGDDPLLGGGDPMAGGRHEGEMPIRLGGLGAANHFAGPVEDNEVSIR